MTPTRTVGSSNSAAADSVVQAPGAYMLTLCRLVKPVTIRPPQAPQLQRFKFFTSRAQHSDGGERHYLHMGYFATVTEAQNWAQVMRRTYPQAIATRVPAALQKPSNSSIPTLQPAQADPTPLTDTQVLNILETRRASPVKDDSSGSNTSDISLLRPEDTNTRRVLKEAVARNAPVSFALQLSWSVQPIDINTVSLPSIVRAYTLYLTESQREGRAWYSLRLGFFKDAISAKQVASYVRSSFSSVAVVPVTEEERTHSGETRVDTTAITDTFGQQFDQALAADRASAPASPVTGSAPAPAAPKPALQPPPSSSYDRDATTTRNPSRTETLEQTLELLASTEMWDIDDSPSDTGVRHLSVEVQKRSAGR